MNIEDVVRAAIPDADDGTIDFVIWSRTPFPMTAVNARSIYRVASGFRRAKANGFDLCGWCNRRVPQGEHTCHRCKTLILGEA